MSWFRLKVQCLNYFYRIFLKNVKKFLDLKKNKLSKKTIASIVSLQGNENEIFGANVEMYEDLMKLNCEANRKRKYSVQ